MHRTLTWILLLSAALVAAATVAAWQLVDAGAASAGDPFTACAGVGQRDARLACVTRVAERLRDEHGIAVALRELDGAAAADRHLRYDCHMALHPVGATEGRRLARAGRPFPNHAPPSFCVEGYVHGMTIAYFEAVPRRQLVGQSVRGCAGSDVFAAWSCAHSMGHLFSRGAGRDMGQAAAMCSDALGHSRRSPLALDHVAWLSSCVKGAVMETTLLNRARSVTDTPRTFCAPVRSDLRIYCDSFLALRAQLASDDPAAQARICLTHAQRGAGRDMCVRIYARTVSPDQCAVLPAVHLRSLCTREGRQPELGRFG